MQILYCPGFFFFSDKTETLVHNRRKMKILGEIITQRHFNQNSDLNIKFYSFICLKLHLSDCCCILMEYM